MKWNKFWLMWDLCGMFFCLFGAFSETSDVALRIHGWCAIGCAAFAAVQWALVESEAAK